MVDESHGAPNRTAPAVKRCGHSAREEKTMVTINTWNELRAILCNLSALTDDELHALMNRIAGVGLPCGCSPMDRAMNGEYSAEHNKLVKKAYGALDDEENARYPRTNREPLAEYRKAHLAGHTVEEFQTNEELRAHWDFYSDYHKDVWGYRPTLAEALR